MGKTINAVIMIVVGVALLTLAFYDMMASPANTSLVLWFGPFIEFLLVALGVALLISRQKSHEREEKRMPLSESDDARRRRMIEEGKHSVTSYPSFGGLAGSSIDRRQNPPEKER